MTKHTGCPHEGGDDRLLHWLICPIQRALSFKSAYEPISILFAFPFYIAINSPIPFSGLTKWVVKKVIHLRLGLRYDMNAHIYLLSAAIKITDRAVFY